MDNPNVRLPYAKDQVVNVCVAPAQGIHLNQLPGFSASQLATNF